MSACIGLVVPTKRVKYVKQILEAQHLLHKSIKIKSFEKANSGDTSEGQCAILPTNIQANEGVTGFLKQGRPEIRALGSLSFLFETSITGVLLQDIVDVVVVEEPQSLGRKTHNPLQQAVSNVLYTTHPTHTEQNMEIMLETMATCYNIFPPMLLLPQHAFTSETWGKFFAFEKECEGHAKPDFFTKLAQEMQVSHIAINAPIPALTNINVSEHVLTETEENLLRSPTHLQPVHGDFGPALPAFPRHIPSEKGFTEAFWVSVRQNGITQIWAPRYTMFSSGNVTEKARVLNMPSVRHAVEEGRRSGLGSTAVDLFAGIGYFAFSYAKAGVSKVLCWDLNPWSLEGLRRGAAANKWSTCFANNEGNTSVIGNDQSHVEINNNNNNQAAFLVFSESNEHAATRIPALRPRLPPIRHVNCGMLPSVGYAWKIAVQALDPNLGGWLHLHETAPRNEIRERAERFRTLVVDYLKQISDCGGKAPEVVVEHIERVKSVGPRIWHIVVDIWVGPR